MPSQESSRAFVAAPLALLLLLLLSPLPMPRLTACVGDEAHAGSQICTQQERKAQPEQTQLVVRVVDKKGRPVTDLCKDEFRVLEDGREQKIESFSIGSIEPLNLGLLIDLSGSRRDSRLAIELEPAARFIEYVIRKGDSAFVMAFSDHGVLMTDFTDDTTLLNQGIQDMSKLRAAGATALYDTIVWACAKKLSTRAGRRSLVIISDASDNASRNSLEKALEAAVGTDTTLHFILSYWWSDWIRRGAPGPGRRVADRLAQESRRVADRLAQETGGQTILAENERDFKDAFKLIAAALTSVYVLGYHPTNTARDGKFRRLKIETTRPGTKVLARKGYYAPKG